MDSFVYDPANPAPTVGGPLCCDGAHLAPGPRDQAEVESRPDVLVYSTPPLDQDTEVTGPVTLDLFAKSSAVDTDFTAKLVDVWPNGYAQNLTEGILRARYRESTAEAAPLTPGTAYEFKVDLWATSNVFLRGHRIRLEVSSSNFPRFDRNLNTGKDAAVDATIVKATNTILHDAAHPSRWCCRWWRDRNCQQKIEKRLFPRCRTLFPSKLGLLDCLLRQQPRQPDTQSRPREKKDRKRAGLGLYWLVAERRKQRS